VDSGGFVFLLRLALSAVPSLTASICRVRPGGFFFPVPAVAPFVILFRLAGVVIAAAPVMDESAGLAVGNTSFGGKDERGGLKFFSGAFAYL